MANLNLFSWCGGGTGRWKKRWKTEEQEGEKKEKRRGGGGGKMEEYTRTGRDRRKQPNPRPFPRRRIVENQAQRVCVSSPLLSLLLLFAAFSSLSLSDFPFLFGRRARARLSRATLLFYDLVSAAAFLFFFPSSSLFVLFRTPVARLCCSLFQPRSSCFFQAFSVPVAMHPRRVCNCFDSPPLYLSRSHSRTLALSLSYPRSLSFASARRFFLSFSYFLSFARFQRLFRSVFRLRSARRVSTTKSIDRNRSGEDEWK